MFAKLKLLLWKLIKTPRNLDESKVLLGQIRFQQIWDRKDEIKKNLQDAEFRVFSQWGDDGIIQFLVKYLDLKDHRFVEFGVENYEESNTKYLMVNNNWEGLILDSSSKNISHIKTDNTYWRYQLTAIETFITAENINPILSENGFTGEVGIFHIDIDGNDYWIWKALSVVDPMVVIVEYNSSFGPDQAITVPYNRDFTRGSAHYSNLYFGASLKAFYHLACEKGYQLVGSNSTGVNAYFVKRKFAKDLPDLIPSDCYMASRFRESRTREGELSFLNMKERRKLLEGLDVFNVETGMVQKIDFTNNI